MEILAFYIEIVIYWSQDPFVLQKYMLMRAQWYFIELKFSF